MKENVNSAMPYTGYISPRADFSLVGSSMKVDHRAAPPMDFAKKMKLIHAYCAMLRMAFDQATSLQTEHSKLLDNSWTLRESFRIAEHENDVCFGASFIDNVTSDVDAYDKYIATAYSTARKAFSASPVYNECDSGFCARCYMIEVLVSLADKVFVRLTGYSSRVCNRLLDGLHRSYQKVASKQRENVGQIADMAVPTAILKRIFEKEVKI